MKNPCFYRRISSAPVGYNEPTFQEVVEGLINVVTRSQDHDRELRLLRVRLRHLKISIALLAVSVAFMAIGRIWEGF